MSKLKKAILLLLSIVLITLNCFSQISDNLQPVNGNIQAKFLKEKIETGANTTVFNLFTIKNNSERHFNGSVRYSTPDDWNLFGENTVNISIPANDSLVLPIRIAVSNTVLGEVGYAIVASVVNASEKQIVTAYSFVNIPRISDVKVKLENKITYFDNKTKKAKVRYKITNDGNINEVIHLEIDGKNELIVNDQVEKGAYSEELSIEAHTDTIVEFLINYKLSDDIKNHYFVNIKYSDQDTSYFNTVWLNRVESKFDYEIPEYYKCAILQLVVNNLLQKNPTFSFNARGNFLFKKQASIYYFLRPASWGPQKPIEDLYGTNSMYYVGFKNRLMDVRLGNIFNKLRQRFYGVGASADFNINNIQFGGFYLKSRYVNADYYGGNFNLITKKHLLAGIGYGELNLFDISQFSQIGVFKSSFTIKQKQKIFLEAGVSLTEHTMFTPYTRLSYGVEFRYKGSFNKWRLILNTEYGSPEYTGVLRGRFNVNANIFYSINNSSRLNFTYLKRDYNPAFYVNDVLQPIRFLHYDKFILEHVVNVQTNTTLFYGGNYLMESTDQLSTATVNNSLFSTDNYRAFLKGRISIPYTKIVLTPQIDMGYINVLQAEAVTNATKTSYLTYNFYFNVTAKNWGLLFLYRNGPFHIYEQFYYYYSNYFSKRLSLISYYDKFLIKDLLKMTLRANYQSDIVSNSNNFTFTTQLDWYLPRDWSLYLLNSFSIRSFKDATNGAILKYSTNYMEVGVRKEINCKQPRVQFYNLKVVFYRDLNGNRKMEKNEPGINSVLAKIKPSLIDNNTASSEFVSVDLLSGPSGEVEYNNIPNGSYTLHYLLMGNIIGNFSREEMEAYFQMDDDKIIYIPYLENNKIIGKIIMNRDPLSSLGELPLENIRVIAEDTKGNNYSALTNKQGKFTLYTPVADHYIVKINNIFYESFELQQPEFIVKFNGYKQFEVTFVFTEKKRKISFDNDLTTEDLQLDDIKVIRKTTLSGKIRDAISLEPIEAEIKIINNKSNKVISRAVSNRLNGNYNISYAAGDHFRIEVISKDHWEHVENLYIEQVISIQNINKDIMLNKLSESREEQKTFIIYDKEEEFSDNFKRGQQIPINYLTFDLKKTRLDPKAQPELDRLIDLLNKNKSVKIELAGHSDDQGNARVEKMMAKRRAEAVFKYLTMHGLDEKRIEVKSYSNSRPLIPGTTEKARAKNRRVEIIVQ